MARALSLASKVAGLTAVGWPCWCCREQWKSSSPLTLCRGLTARARTVTGSVAYGCRRLELCRLVVLWVELWWVKP